MNNRTMIRILTLVLALACLLSGLAMAEEAVSEAVESAVEEMELCLGGDEAEPEANIEEIPCEIEGAPEESDALETEAIPAAAPEEEVVSNASNPSVLSFWSASLTCRAIADFNLKSEPYASAAAVGKVAAGDLVSFTHLVLNGYCNLWGRVGQNGYAYLGYKISGGRWKKDGTQYFMNVRAPGDSEIRFSDIAYPASYTIDPDGFCLSGGTVESTYPLKSLKTEIASASGKVISSCTRSITGTRYNVRDLDTFSSGDNGVKFSWIQSPGAYTWKLTATDQTGYSASKTMSFTACNGQAAAVKINPTDVALNLTAVTLKAGENRRLTATVSPANATDKTLIWYSDNDRVATVSDGIITARSAGTATIQAQTVNYKTAAVKVTVTEARTEIEPTGISLGTGEIRMLTGGYFMLKPAITPASAANQSVSYRSSDTAVVKVNASGRIDAVGAGTAIVIASTCNGMQTAVNVIVIESVMPSRVSIDYHSSSASVGTPFQLSATLSPSNARSGLIWSSSKPSVATVNEWGVVTPLQAGKTTITVRTDNGRKAKLKITVTDPRDAWIISFMVVGTKTLRVGEQLRITPHLEPDTAIVTRFWSSKPSVAQVDASGRVTALKAGKAKIYAQSRNGKKAFYTVKVG